MPGPPPKRERRPGQEAAHLENNSSAQGNKPTPTGAQADLAFRRTGAVVPLRRPGLEIGAVKLIGKGSLIALVTVKLLDGITLIDCPVLAGERGPWVALPARPSLDRDGRQRVVDSSRCCRGRRVTSPTASPRRC
jgi:DNA-binding cell septation regulator SpoVG